MTSLLRIGKTLLALGLAAALVACGGGSSAAPSYGGGLTPGSVNQLTITSKVTLTTNYGVINIGLDATHAPLSTANILAYVNSGFYTNTLFHRVVPGFVIQGGGIVNTNGTYATKATNAAIALESRNGLSNTQYTLGMARTSDPNSATSQFYVNLVNNAASLDYPAADDAGYAVFGVLLDQASIVTVNAIAGVATNSSAQPLTDVVVLSAVQTL
jgi:cyclophilin family peptidyl-prolyl cis-trans isomerase